MSDPNCSRCHGSGVIRTPVTPRTWCGQRITAWCTPCGCGQIDDRDFGPAIARAARNRENGGRVP